ncbi:MAG: outer membrane beta-barrel protein [Saprospiraceae bacterium]|nr:outer membrane beta-barrel protein [Saprospiraceae bacterium]
MKKSLFILIALVAMSISLQAQVVFKKGAIDLSAGVGLVPTYVADGAHINMLPVNLRLGYRITNNFSMSAFAAYSASEKNNVLRPDDSVDNIKNEEVTLGLRGAIHALRAERFDIYGGFMLGYNMPNTDVTQVSAPKSDTVPGDLQPSFSRPASNKMTYSGFVGAAYFPGRNVGFFSELGYGISLFNVGMQWKLR